MILTEREPGLPATVQSIKAEVLLCLQTAHSLHTYETVSDLIGFLDRNLQAAGMDGLARVVLFYRTPQARIEVEQRMLADGTLTSFWQPRCWMQLAPSLPKLRARAEQLEPGWVVEQMKQQVHP